MRWEKPRFLFWRDLKPYKNDDVAAQLDAALERATKLLRCLPASRLHAADLTDNMAAPPAGPTLHARSEPAVMGEVTAFLSHSWSDEDEAPGAKHALVSHWARWASARSSLKVHCSSEVLLHQALPPC